ncbi:NADPH-dependent FMN reductase [Seohaeicola zhoushanensis]|uniref:FMN reductase n=1 Tax=Seohaeicola zhoushanensis TaxID=1569283 RepID=A0A8J3GWF6_9RHOB|nr:NAD(P)H-dependent oxidoreductase [Seohaeicola zhoushanensis]GHF44076.1 FMN reductase [Seohaeicola zhoushanensis]
MTSPRIAVIIGTTRPTRFGHKPAEWIKSKIEQDGRMSADILDLAEYDLPMFEEMASNKWMPSKDPKAVKWQEDLAKYDGYVFIVAEYNHSISGALKNALDQAFVEWDKKPAAVVGYGGTGAARAVEHLRNIAVELRMVNVASAVHIAGGELMKVHPLGGVQDGKIEDIEPVIGPSAKALVDELYWWADLLKGARAEAQAKAA